MLASSQRVRPGRYVHDLIFSKNSRLRQSHGVSPLQYNAEMAKAAQKFAETLAAKDVLEHSKKDERDNAGENVAMSMRPFVDYSYSGISFMDENYILSSFTKGWEPL